MSINCLLIHCQSIGAVVWQEVLGALQENNTTNLDTVRAVTKPKLFERQSFPLYSHSDSPVILSLDNKRIGMDTMDSFGPSQNHFIYEELCCSSLLVKEYRASSFGRKML